MLNKQTNTKTDFLKEARPLAQSLLDFATISGNPYGISDVEISISASNKQRNTVEEGVVSRSISGASYGVEIILHAGDKTLSFTKNTLDENILRDAIEQNMQVIHMVPDNKDSRLLEPEKVYKGARLDLNLYDTQQPDQDSLIAYAKTAEKAALAHPAIKTTEAVEISKNDTHCLVLATNGLDSYEAKTIYQAHAYVVAESQNGMEVDGEYSIARHFRDMSDPQKLGEQAGKNAAAKLNATLPKTGKMPIILSHEAAESFFSSVYSAIDGQAVYQESTFLKDKIGEQVMSANITLVDDPRIERGLASQQTDTVGLEARKITFIKDGILQSYNVNLRESRQLGIDPIGREDGPTNSSILPGTQTPEELMADIKEGIYIKGFNGGTVDFNNGTHSRQAYGTLIKNGKVTDIAVDGFVVSGNLKDMFMNLVIANDTPALPSTKHSLAAPTTRINGLTIAGQ